MTELGFMIVLLGIACADSDCLLIPLAIVSVGALLILLGNKKTIKK